jgi:rod shape-determining protein MreC
VKTVDPGLSLAIMWTHPDFRASATAVDGTASGIVSAHLGTGPERYLLELRGVAFRDTLRSGTMIVTSGLGGVFPRGIPIGTVLGEVPTTEKWTRTYLLKPAVRPPDVTAVMVLLPEPEPENLETVWTSMASADSAMRRIAAAGDSIARDSAQAAQRRAAAAAAASTPPATDSARRDSTPRAPARRDTTAGPPRGAR